MTRSSGSLLRVASVVTVVMLGCSGNGTTTSTNTEASPATDLSPGQPYPFATPAPPETATPVDGAYSRRTTVRQAGGEPIFCQRCAPYRVDAGFSELILDRGSFYVSFDTTPMESPCPDCRRPPGFKSSGYFTVSGDEIVFFNDPNCTDVRGIYRWTREQGALRFELVKDPCPFVHLRARYLTSAPWYEGSAG